MFVDIYYSCQFLWEACGGRVLLCGGCSCSVGTEYTATNIWWRKTCQGCLKGLGRNGEPYCLLSATNKVKANLCLTSLLRRLSLSGSACDNKKRRIAIKTENKLYLSDAYEENSAIPRYFSATYGENKAYLALSGEAEAAIFATAGVSLKSMAAASTYVAPASGRRQSAKERLRRGSRRERHEISGIARQTQR